MDANAPLRSMGSPSQGLTGEAARVQGMLLGSREAARAVELLAHVAREMVESALGAGASLMDEGGRRTSTGSTDPIVATADEVQYRLGAGPCISAWETNAVQRISDTSTDSRWPGWGPAAHDMGIVSVLSAPLVFRGEVIGALKVYSSATDAFSAEDERRLVLLAGAAATLLGAAQDADAPQRLSAVLKSALRTRQVVETATGMLMERHHISREDARNRLLEASRARRQPLTELAGLVIGRSADPDL